ncbi:MAG: energy transducer TonB [Bacteroidota bacterium]
MFKCDWAMLAIALLLGTFQMGAAQNEANEPTGKNVTGVVDLMPEQSSTSGEEMPQPNDFVLLNRQPQPLNLTEIKRAMGYPPEAVKQKIEGKVIVRILIDREGVPIKHRFIKAVDPLLDQVVLDNIYDLRFEPARYSDNSAGAAWLTMPFQFELSPK